MNTGGPSHRNMATMSVPEKPAGLPERTRAASLGPGERVGPYVVDGEIGRDALGIMLAVTEPTSQRRFALKIVRPDEQDPQAAGRMMLEARRLSTVAHPNVVAIHDVGQLEDGQIYLATDIPNGRSLRISMRDDRPPAAIVDLFLQAGRGLAAAHHAGLVHRDFTPDHVLVGQDGRARVTDFGLASGETQTPNADPTRPRTIAATGAGIVTPAYMAPEQHLGAPASPKTDQFAFAVSLYEGLTGHLPFPGSIEDMQTAKLGAGRMAWQPHRPIPPALTAAVDRALLRDPDARYASMGEFLAALEPIAPALESAPHVSGPSTAMSAPIVPGAYPQYQNTRPPPPIQMVASPARPDRTLQIVLGVVGLIFLFAIVGAVAFFSVRSASSRAPALATPGSAKPQAAPVNVGVIPMPGPRPAAPIFVPVMANMTANSKLPCPAGSKITKEDSPATASVRLYCFDSKANMREGPYVEFAARNQITVHQTYLHNNVEGRAWTFAEGLPTTMQEFKAGLPNGEKYGFGPRGAVVDREHFVNGKREGLSESWNVMTGEPVSARLYANDQVMGRSN